MKNNIANAYLGQKAAQNMYNEIAVENANKQPEQQVSLISTMMLRNGIGGTLDTHNQEPAPKASRLTRMVKTLSQKLFFPKTA